MGGIQKSLIQGDGKFEEEKTGLITFREGSSDDPTVGQLVAAFGGTAA